MSEPRAQEWPELESCACGYGELRTGRFAVTDTYRVGCCHGDTDGCLRSAEGRSPAESAAAWNAMQRVAKGEKEADDAVR